MKTLYLARHGESVTNLTDETGNPFSDLTPKGLKQSGQLAEKLNAPIIWSSDFTRSIQTAQAFKIPRLSDPNFNERSFGLLEKEDGQVILREYKKHLDKLPRHERSHIRFVKDMESDLDAYFRFKRGLDNAVEYPHDAMIIVSHSNIMRIFLDYSGLLTLPPGAIKNCGYIKLGYNDGRYFVLEKHL